MDVQPWVPEPAELDHWEARVDLAAAFNRLCGFERAVETRARALQTGKLLRRMSTDVAEKVAVEPERYPDQAERHFAAFKAILDCEGSGHAS